MDDVEPIQSAVYGDPEVCHFYCRYTRSIEETRRWIAYRIHQLEDPGIGFVCIERKEDAAVMGVMALQMYLNDGVQFEDAPDYPCSTLETELSYAFGRQYQKHGYAQEAGRALIGYGFGEARLPRLVNAVHPQNGPSIRLMHRLGFRLTRNLKPDGWHDVIGILDNPLLAAEEA
jgi:RimJ/RimL family protein N-acetyltransferase